MKLDVLQKNTDEQKEVNEANHVSRALEQMDAIWWKIRIQLDRYLDAADGQVTSFKEALTALHAYTSECTTNFAGLKDAFVASARVERQTHAVLKEVWLTVLPAVGVLTAKIEDEAYLLLFAKADVRTMDIGEHFGLPSSLDREQICTNHNKRTAVAEKEVRTAIKKGIYGQALSQLRVMLGHLIMLEDRFIFGGLGTAPSAKALATAAKRLKVAKMSVDEAIPNLAEGVLKQAVRYCQ